MVAAIFEQEQFWHLLASSASAVAVWAQQHIRPRPTPEQDLTAMIRQPIRWTMRHPVIALKRKADRRRS
jgi:hypothetical protein